MRRIERAARVLERSRLGGLMRWHGALVLNYHRIGAPQVGFDANLWSATPQELDEQFEFLARNFDVIGPEELAASSGGRGRRLLITFDDGYRDNHEQALPALRRHGLTATFFIVPGFIDSPRVPWWDEIAWMVSNAEDTTEDADDLVVAYKQLPGSETHAFLDRLAERCGTGRCPRELADGLWMTWDHVREVAAAGSKVGGHTLNHPVLSRLPRDEQAAEITGCAKRLREVLGVEMEWFSYPVGLPDAYDEVTKELLAQSGVKLAFAFAGGFTRGGALDPLAVPRTGVSFGTSQARFAATVTVPSVFARW